jgi:hypothetical protein
MIKLETKVMERKKTKTMHKNNKNSRKSNKKKESQSLMQNIRKLEQMKKEVKIMRKEKPFYHWGGYGFTRRQLQALQVPLGKIWIPYCLPLRN